MNLAFKDIRKNLGRFVMTTIGIGMLLMIVMGMAGIYRGLLEDATFLINKIGADLWIVQQDTRGPFAELSRVPTSLVYRAQAVPGVASAREFVFHTIQREHRGALLRMSILGLSWPEDKGEWLQLVAGRPLRENHYEMIADKSLGLELGEQLRLGKDEYTIVGITAGMVSTGGDGMAFTTLLDSQAIQFDSPSEAIRLERAARDNRGQGSEVFMQQPQLTEQLALPSSQLPAIAAPSLSAVLVTIKPGADLDKIQSLIESWQDVSVYTTSRPRRPAGARHCRQGSQATLYVPCAAHDYRCHHYGPDHLHAYARQDLCHRVVETDRCTEPCHPGHDLATSSASGRTRLLGRLYRGYATISKVPTPRSAHQRRPDSTGDRCFRYLNTLKLDGYLESTQGRT